LQQLIVIVRALRVYQWTKNLLLLAALIFSKEFFEIDQVLTSLLAFLAFSLTSSATYLLNDLVDVEKDRKHPTKRHRPIASGALSRAAALGLMVGLLCLSMALAYYIQPRFLGALLFYLALTVSYSFVLKDILILDVLTVALGFVVRAIAGAIAIDVLFSNWLVVCTLFLALFLGLSKRRHELTILDEDARNHRAVLHQYSVHFLDQLILITAGGALITYTIYTCSEDVIARIGTPYLYLTLPFVFYGLARYLYLIHHKTGGGDPSSTLLKDLPLGLTVVSWALACVVILYV